MARIISQGHPDYKVNIRGVARSASLIDNNDWLSDWSGDGRLYPQQYRIYKEEASNRFLLVDETRWDGYQEVSPFLVSSHETYEEAAERRIELLS